MQEAQRAAAAGRPNPCRRSRSCGGARRTRANAAWRRARRAWFEHALQSLRQAAVEAHWDRIDAALAMHLERAWAGPGSTNSGSGCCIVPGDRYVALSLIMRTVSAIGGRQLGPARVKLSGEVDACIAESAAARRVPGGSIQLPVIERGLPQYEARRHAPGMLTAFAGLALARIPNVAPHCEIVAMAGGSRIATHHGLANSRCRAIVNLADSAPIEILVGTQKVLLEPGQSRYSGSWLRRRLCEPRQGGRRAQSCSNSAHARLSRRWNERLCRHSSVA